MNRIGVNFNPVKPKGRKILSRKTALGRPIPVITGMGGVLRDIESKNAQKIDELSQGVLAQGKVISEEITKQSAIALNAIDAVKSENTALYNELGSHILANNPHGITKETVGLGRVDNTADFEKPVSIAVGMALDQKADKEELKTIEDRIEESIKEQEKIKTDVKNIGLMGGIGGNELPAGGKKGQVLKKKSDVTGDYKWADDAVVTVHNDLTGRDATDCHPISAITNLQTELNGKQQTISDLDEIRAGASAGATAVQPSEMTTAISGHNTSEQAHSYIRGLITSETTNRENADIGLQNQIDAITASSDVKDIVGTYAQLQAYDTSTLGNNDIIKVLQDETHDNETTYYRWNTTTETFTLIGEEGPYYTKGQADSTFVPQTRTINGNALSSNISLGSADVGALPDSTKYGSDLSLTSGNLQLLDQDGNALGNSVTVPDASNFANKDLSNLTSTGKNISNWSSNVTNCITEIPQDIKLELDNGTLTLKSGSKVYCPNGSGVFNIITTSSDLTATQTKNGLYLVVVDSTGSYIGSATVDRFSSGSSDSLSGQTYHSWYDTTNNLIKRYRSSGSTVDHYESFPIALVTVTNGAISSIDQVFNGFGYIGSTVFVLPNIKSLNPQGFNTDGTLKSDVVTNSSVKTFSCSGSNYGMVFGQSGANYLFQMNVKAYAEQPTPPTTFDNGNALWFNTETNYFYRTEDSGSTWIGPVAFTKYFSLYVDNNGKVTNFVPYHTFRSLNYYDKDTISGWAMPSKRYIDLTLGASGTSYTAPANGYFYLRKRATAVGQYMSMKANDIEVISDTGSSTNNIGLIYPAKKGQEVTVYYNLGGATGAFRFVYLDGEVE